MEYGLIGEHLGHSFSKEIHEQLGTYKYELKELNQHEFITFMETKPFKAINVTIPYKEKVIPYLDYIDPVAKQIGAVNTIINHNGILKGYNTDYLGLKALVDNLGVKLENSNVLILGSGGTSKTAYALCQMCGVKSCIKASLEPNSDIEIPYSQLPQIASQIDIIINTTPCGMYPNNNQELVDITNFPNLRGVVDVIYNPLRTRLVEHALNKGLKASGGLYMLVAQAVYASNLFQNKNNDNVLDIVNNIYNKLIKTKENIVLIGMPSCGKTKLGKLTSMALGRELVDTDNEIVQVIKGNISNYILEYGEPAFRQVEKEVIDRISKKSGIVIATGGGAVLDIENVLKLKQNGKLFFINRSLEKLEATSSRPLSSSKELLEKRYNERLPIYKRCADVIINGDLELDEKVKLIIGD